MQMLVSQRLEVRYFSWVARWMTEQSRSMRRKPKKKAERVGVLLFNLSWNQFFFLLLLEMLQYNGISVVPRYMAYIMDTNEEERVKVLYLILASNFGMEKWLHILHVWRSLFSFLFYYVALGQNCWGGEGPLWDRDHKIHYSRCPSNFLSYPCFISLCFFKYCTNLFRE